MDIHQSVQPKHVMAIYSNDKMDYVEIADVRKDGTLAPFHPLSTEQAFALGGTLLNKTVQVKIGRIPSNLLFMNYVNGTFEAVWITYPKRQRLYFSKTMKIEDGYAPIPTLVWAYKGGKLHLFALPDATDIKGDSQLYYAPYHNIYNDSSVCLGSGTKFIKKDTDSIMVFMNSVEQAFFDSKFTMIHVNTINGNLNLLYQDLIQNDKMTFPVDVLLPVKGMRLSHFLDLTKHEANDYTVTTHQGPGLFEREDPQEDDEDPDYDDDDDEDNDDE